MKGSLFPLGQPLREPEDQPRVGFMPKLSPCLLLGGRSVLGSQTMASSPPSASLRAGMHPPRAVGLMILQSMNGEPRVGGWALLFTYM